MSVEEAFGQFFKSETRSSGEKLFHQDKIHLSSKSDTAIHAYARVSPPAKVQLSSPDIGHVAATAHCNCPASVRGLLCKHVWATLLCIEKEYPDFLAAKQVIEKRSEREDAPGGSTPSYQAAAKLRAAQYRKDQYERQKLRAKEFKERRRGSVPPARAYPAAIEEALAYFTRNGFSMEGDLNEGAVGEAKRKLSRVFHPDKGGSNDEIVELNRNCERVLEFLRT